MLAAFTTRRYPSSTAVDDQVVDDSADIVGQQGVLGLSGLDSVQVVRQEPLQRPVRIVPRQLQLAHVGHVEHAGVLANGPVLVDDRRVLHGHLPAGEGDEAGAEGGVAVEERRPPKRLHVRKSHSLRRVAQVMIADDGGKLS